MSTDPLRALVVASYDSGLGIERVALRHRVSRKFVRTSLQRAGVALRPRSEAYLLMRKIAPNQTDLMRAAYEAGHSLDSIGAQYGVSGETVAKRLRETGATIRSSAPAFSAPRETRRAAVEHAKKHGITAAGRAFGKHHKTIKEWGEKLESEPAVAVDTKEPEVTITIPAVPITACFGCGQPSRVRLCEWCSLVA